MTETFEFTLLPAPRSLMQRRGTYSLRTGQRIVLDGPQAADLLFTGRQLQRALRQLADVSCELSATSAGAPADIGVTLEVGASTTIHPQGYELRVSNNGVSVRASTPAGAFYGAMTLIQLLEQLGPALPFVDIADSPDFENRGIMLDISRDKVPTLDTLYGLIDMFAAWKLNQVQLYTEHTFAYYAHPEVWAEASPLTGDDILKLDAYCRDRFIELVPNQNSFGHMERWLAHPRYRALSEFPDGVRQRGPEGWIGVLAPQPFGATLSPTDPGSIQLVRSLYDELLPHFTSQQFNVGCDETFDLTRPRPSSAETSGRSSGEIRKDGVGRVYLDFLLKIYDEVSSRGYTMQYWGDIVAEHPTLIRDLPSDAIALEWGYDADHPFDERCARYAESGLPFYVCPGTSSWGTIAGRTDECIANLHNAARAGIQYSARGFLNTDWGEDGHRQLLPVSFLGFAVGAAVSWVYATNRHVDVAAVLSRHVFGDRTGVMGRVAIELGSVYRLLGVRIHNSTVLGRIMRTPIEQLHASPESVSPEGFPRLELFDRVISSVEEIASMLDGAEPTRLGGTQIVREYQLTARLLKHACMRAILSQDEDPSYVASLVLGDDMGQLMDEYQALWLARNRPGGLADSMARLAQLRGEYASIADRKSSGQISRGSATNPSA